MKKRILILISGFTHGGTNKSLMNFLGVMDFDKYDIEIFSLYNDRGPYRKLLSDYTVLEETLVLPKFFPFQKGEKEDSGKSERYDKAVVWYTRIRLHFLRDRFFAKIGKKLSEKNYDVVIAFQEGFTTELSTYIASPHHIAWVRCDYSRYLKLSGREETRIYEKTDHIIAVSEYTAQVMRECIPSCADKIMGLHNIIDWENMIEQSKKNITDPNFTAEPFTLISVGRMDPVKRFSYIPQIASRLKKENVKFKWYIIGDGGSEKNNIRKEIEKYGLKEDVILLGAKNDPYPYIKQSSVLVTLSSSEACPNVVNEAKILHIPVAAADFPTAKEYIQNGFDGIICPVEEMASELSRLYFDRALLERLKTNVSHFTYDNEHIKSSIEKLLDE